jgi:hypothetical protein
MIFEVCIIDNVGKTIWIVLNFKKELQGTNGCHEVANQKDDILGMLPPVNFNRAINALNINMVLFG